MCDDADVAEEEPVWRLIDLMYFPRLRNSNSNSHIHPSNNRSSIRIFPPHLVQKKSPHLSSLSLTFSFMESIHVFCSSTIRFTIAPEILKVASSFRNFVILSFAWESNSGSITLVAVTLVQSTSINDALGPSLFSMHPLDRAVERELV